MRQTLPVNTHLSKKLGQPRVTGILDRKETVGDRIRERQRATRVKNEELAQAADVHVKTVSQWRSNRQTPTDDNLMAIAPVLKTTFLYLKNGLVTVVTDEEGVSFSRSRNLAVHEGRRLYTSIGAKRLPPRAYTLVYEYLQRLENAGLKSEELDEAERFLVDGAYNKINAREPGDKTEDDLILDIKAAWQFVREVVNRNGARV
jgi:transcriptional regulator with XRE-family HTH domain